MLGGSMDKVINNDESSQVEDENEDGRTLL